LELPIKFRLYRRWFISAVGTRRRLSRRYKLLAALALFTLSFAAKSLHAVDLAPLMYTAEQPFSGLSVSYDARAASILRGEGLLGPYQLDPSQTEWLAQAPGYSIYLSAIYRVLGRDFFKVQLVQNLINSFSPVLIFLIAGSIISWRVGFASGLLAASSHHMSHISNFILPDSVCALPILAAVYCVACTKTAARKSYPLYLTAGILIGLSVWLRPQSMLLGVLIAGLLLFISPKPGSIVKQAILLCVVSLLLVVPITIRNYIVYHAFLPVNIGVGITLWEGIADGGGDRFGAVATDDEVAAQEAISYNNPLYDASMFTPDGISRDRDRVSKSMAIIRQHPIWYAGVVVHRMKEMFKYSAHAPLVQLSRPSSVIIAARGEWESIAKTTRLIGPGYAFFWLRPGVRATERATKETMLLFVMTGFALMLGASPRRALLISCVPIYYLLFQSLVHTEFRYTLPMQYFVFVFAAIVWAVLWGFMLQLVVRVRRSRAVKQSVSPTAQ
jgi:dolichyl-phosphate-mannose-protein mannosyltransferase